MTDVIFDYPNFLKNLLPFWVFLPHFFKTDSTSAEVYYFIAVLLPKITTFLWFSTRYIAKKHYCTRMFFAGKEKRRHLRIFAKGIFQTLILRKSNVAASPKMLLIISKHIFLQGIQYVCIRRKWCIIGASASFQEKCCFVSREMLLIMLLIMLLPY